MHPDLVRQIRRLQANADAVLQLLFLPIGIKVEHLHVAARASAETFQNLHGGRLPRAVRPEQAEDLTGADFEVDPLDRFEAVVAHAQTADRNSGRRTHWLRTM